MFDNLVIAIVATIGLGAVLLPLMMKYLFPQEWHSMLRWIDRPSDKNLQTISDKMQADMDRNVAERKAKR